ncbi:MAG: hypothetical protein PHR79_03475 [Bacteroidales bacterium]|nr:hypothetical protein [Bacteroidales bacterium]
MKRSHLNLIVLFILSAFVFSGCGLKKMTKKYPDVRYEVKPEMLETNGGKVQVTINGKIPPKYFHKKAMMEIVPVLQSDKGTIELRSIKLKGEKAEGEGTVINKKLGGSFSYTETFNYDPNYNSSVLYANAKAQLKKKSAEMTQIKLADGIIYTSERTIIDPELSSQAAPGTGTNVIFANHGYEKEVLISKEAVIYFELDRSDLNWRVPLNQDAKSKEQLESFIDFIKKEYKVKELSLNAWASPEGEESRNSKLSESRSATANKWFKDQVSAFRKAKAKELKIKEKDVQSVLPELTPKANGEDWEGFMKAIEASNIKDKNAILNVVRNQADVARREQEIRNMTVIYQEIEENILPPLRRAVIKLTCLEPRKTDEDIATLATTEPEKLDTKEIFYSATLTNDLATKEKIYRNAIKTYPEDWRGYNDLAAVLIMTKNYSEAKTMAEKANTMSPNNGLVLNNLGVIAMINRDFASAKSYIESSQKNGVNQNYNMGIFAIKEGDYAKAISLFGNKTCDYNVALAQLLSGNLNGAAQNLDCMKNKTAASHYLAAVVASRSGNKASMLSNLKKACEMDASFKAQAKDDREFMKHFSHAEFLEAIR